MVVTEMLSRNMFVEKTMARARARWRQHVSAIGGVACQRTKDS